MAKESLGTFFVNIIGDASELEKALNRAKRSVDRTARQFQDATQAAGRAFTVIGAGVVGALGGMVKTAADFESAFIGVRKTVEATEPEFKKLRDGILDMSEEIPTAQNELAGIMEIAGQLGVTGVDNLLKFTRTAADLGETTNLSAEEAATALARFTNITQGSLDDVDKLGSVIVELGNNFATTEAEITEMALRLAGAGSVAGFSQDEILSLGAALSSVGIRAEAGGTAMSKFIINMQASISEVDNSEKANKKFLKTSEKLEESIRQTSKQLRRAKQDLGGLITAKERTSQRSINLRRRIEDLTEKLGEQNDKLGDAAVGWDKATSGASGASSELKQFAEVAGKTTEEMRELIKNSPAEALQLTLAGFGRVKESGGDLLKTLEEMNITEIRLRDSILRAAGASDLFSDAMERGKSALNENTALTDEATKRYESFWSQINIAKNSLRNLLIVVGEPVLGDFNVFLKETLIPTVREVGEKVAAWVKENSDLVATLAKVSAGFGLFMVTLGPILLAIPGLIQSLKIIIALLKFGLLKALIPLASWLATIAANMTMAALASGGFVAALGGVWAAVSPLIAVVLGLAAAFALIESFFNRSTGADNFISRFVKQLEGLQRHIDILFRGLVRLKDMIAGLFGAGGSAAQLGPRSQQLLDEGRLGNIPGLAHGGTVVRKGLTLVGERGPELLNLPQGAQVTPNLGGIAAAAPNIGPFNFHFPNASMRSEDDKRAVRDELSREFRKVLNQELRGLGLAV